MEQENKDVIRSYLGMIMTEGAERALAKHAVPNYVYRAQGVGEIQGRVGEILNWMKDQLSGQPSMTIHGMIAEGDRVAVEAEFRAPFRDGRVYNNKYHFLFEMKDGRIVVVREYHDTKHSHEFFPHLYSAAS